MRPTRRRPPVTRAAAVVSADPVEALIARARRLRERGDARRALATLRQACFADEWRGRTFALLGAWLLEAGAHAEATQRLRHATWLFEREGAADRASALRPLLARAAA